MSGGGGSGGGQDPSYFANIEHDKLDREQRERRAEEDARQARIRQGTDDINTRFSDMFTPEFYDKRQKEYVDYYRPQLDEQFADAQKNLTYWLADRGQLDSSVRNDKLSELQKMFDTGTRQIGDAALNRTSQLKSDVAGAQAGLIDDVRSNADPGYAGTAATSRVSALATPDTYSPMSNLFGTFASALAQQAAYERADNAMGRGVGGPPIGAFNTRLFAPNADDTRVQR